MQRAVLLDVVVGESAAVLQLLAREDEALLVGGDALLVLDLGLDMRAHRNFTPGTVRSKHLFALCDGHADEGGRLFHQRRRRARDE